MKTTQTLRAPYLVEEQRFYPVRDPQGNEIDLRSVTSVYKALAKEALIAWSGKENRHGVLAEADRLALACDSSAALATLLRQTCEKRQFHREKQKGAADLGTWAHARCEWLARQVMGETVGVDPLHSPECLTQLNGDAIDAARHASDVFQRWLDHEVLVPTKVETVVHYLVPGYVTTGFAGRADLHATIGRGYAELLPDEDLEVGLPVVVDLKTSKAIYREMIGQAEAYRIASNYSLDGIWMRSMLLRLPKVLGDPVPQLVVPSPDDADAAFDAFLHLCRVADWLFGPPSKKEAA